MADRYVSHGGPASTWHIVREWSPLTRCGRRVVDHEDQWPQRSVVWKDPRCRSCTRLLKADWRIDMEIAYERAQVEDEHVRALLEIDPPA